MGSAREKVISPQHLFSPQRHALEQRHHPQGLGGVHQVAAEGAAARSRAGEPPEEAGAGQQEAAAQDPGDETRHVQSLNTSIGSPTVLIRSH